MEIITDNNKLQLAVFFTVISAFIHNYTVS